MSYVRIGNPNQFSRMYRSRSNQDRRLQSVDELEGPYTNYDIPIKCSSY